MKMAIIGLLRHFGYQITRVGDGIPRRTFADALAHIVRMSQDIGFEPATVIDVGVADGTPDLYESFPKARLLLVEPLKEFEGVMRRICRRYNAMYVIAAASDKEGVVSINITPDLHGSSLLKPKETSLILKTREVKTVTLDALIEDFDMEAPFVLKVDAQGGELRILEGAIKTVEKSEVIILEVQLFQGTEGGPQLFDIVAFLKSKGFVAYDIVGNNYRPLDRALAEVDIVFVKEDGIFRSSHLFATPEQRRKQFARPDRRFRRIQSEDRV